MDEDDDIFDKDNKHPCFDDDDQENDEDIPTVWYLITVWFDKQ